jgi:hypothetical protein
MENYILIPNRVGNRAEAVVMAEFTRYEIPIAIPFGDNEPYDFIAETYDHKLIKIQVKSGKLKRGCVFANTHKKLKQGSVKVPYEPHEVDLFVIYCDDNRSAWILPRRDLLHVQLKMEDNGSGRGDLASDYEFASMIDKYFLNPFDWDSNGG